MTNARVIKFLDIFSYVLILLSVFIVPLFIDKSLLNFYIIPKQYVFAGFILLNILVFAIKMVLSKKIKFQQSVFDAPLLVFLLLVLASSLFSVNSYVSFLGRGEFFLLNFVFLLFSVFFYFIFVNHVNSARRWSAVLELFLLVSGLVSLFFIVKTVFKFSLPYIGAMTNLLDPTSSQFGVLMIAAAVLSAGLLMKKNIGVGRAIAYFFTLILAIIPLLIMGFSFLWWLLLIGLVLLLLLGVSFMHNTRIGWLSVIFALLVVSCVFVIFGSPKSLQTALPAEVSLGLSPSWRVARGAVLSGAKTFLLGSGPGTFAADFSRFRDQSFNYDQLAWSLRFNQPFDTLLAFLAEGGVLVSLTFLLISLLVLGHIFSTWHKSRGPTPQSFHASLSISRADLRLDVFLAAVVWLILWSGMTVAFYNPALWFFWWLFLALIVSGMSLLGHEVLKEKVWTLEDTPQYHLAISFSLIAVMAAVILVGVLGSRFYLAEKAYTQSLRASDVRQAQEKIAAAIALRDGNDQYHATLANAYLTEAATLSKKPNPDLRQIADLMAKAVNAAKKATELSPNDVVLQETLATMYENAAMLVPEASQWAVKSWGAAIELEPTNAFLRYRLANNYFLSKNISKAIEAYKQAVDLKRDFAVAHGGLALAYEADKQYDSAIESYRNALSLNPANSELIFNLGRLLYNRNKGADRAAAEKLWLEAVRLQPNYSNALYSLGLYYENLGNKTAALQYYYKVKDLNPDNKDITAKIKSLVGR
ncbi:tetratricopeptide repeat protein [Patescibacteria group bacterium]|nr:MAG: tetratricopeptide repeat protein [Patescibacteria group bacterium]